VRGAKEGRSVAPPARLLLRRPLHCEAEEALEIWVRLNVPRLGRADETSSAMMPEMTAAHAECSGEEKHGELCSEPETIPAWRRGRTTF
jgi:hypothetical protein